jgi:hypothetical protein
MKVDESHILLHSRRSIEIASENDQQATPHGYTYRFEPLFLEICPGASLPTCIFLWKKTLNALK